MGNKVYVCYEQNGGELVLDGEAVVGLCVKADAEGAADWVMERLAHGKEEGWVFDPDECVECEDGEISKSEVFESIKRGCLDIEMFYQETDNWDRCYDIIVTKEVVE